jgi:hypothetical protein
MRFHSHCHVRGFVALCHSHHDGISATIFHSSTGAERLHNAAANGDPDAISDVDCRSDPDEHAHGYTRADRDTNVPPFSDCDVFANPYTSPGTHRNFRTR